MKKLFILPLAILFAASCSENKTAETSENTTPAKDTTLAFFGDTIDETGATEAANVFTSLKGKDSVAVKLTGKIVDVCQKKGCWMEVDLGNNQTMRVTFKDYAFFVPKDAAGKTAVIDGYAYTDTTTVAQLKHYAEDGGKSKAEIDAIKEPEINTSFEARGVIIKK